MRRSRLANPPYDRPPVYIAAPLGGPDIDCNVLRAELLAMLAARDGLTPVYVHSVVQRGVLGDDDEPADRARGLEIAASMLRLVRLHPAGRLWVLERDNGAGLSQGVQLEVNLWRGDHGSRRGIQRRGAWAAWQPSLHAAGLGDEWAALARMSISMSVST
jgi:hypothetical protein